MLCLESGFYDASAKIHIQTQPLSSDLALAHSQGRTLATHFYILSHQLLSLKHKDKVMTRKLREKTGFKILYVSDCLLLTLAGPS